MKNKKIWLGVMATITILCGIFAGSQGSKISGLEAEIDSCGITTTRVLDSSIRDLANRSRLSECGKKYLANAGAVAAPLRSAMTLCDSGVGCYSPSSGKIVVAQASSFNYSVFSHYDYSYSTSCGRYYCTRYTYRRPVYITRTMSISEAEAQNTVRHEALHAIYAKLSSSERNRVGAALKKYETGYANQLSAYSASNRAEELFVRVGADEKKLGDSEDERWVNDLYAEITAVHSGVKVARIKKRIDAAASLFWASIVGAILSGATFFIFMSIPEKSKRGGRAPIEARKFWVESIYQD